jgi:hypothetical protein
MKIIITVLFIFLSNLAFSQLLKDTLFVTPYLFKTTTTIHFEVSNRDSVSLKIYNLVGEGIKSFFDKTYLPSGSYAIFLDAKDWKEGIYIIQLKIGEKVYAKKIVKDIILNSNEEDLNSKVYLYPNPTYHTLNIPIIGNKKMIITDLTGKIIKTIETKEQEIYLHELIAGQYFILIYNSENQLIINKKFTKF